MNSKTEYSRCRLPRLVIDNEEGKKAKKEEKKDLEKVTEEPETDIEIAKPRGLETEMDTNRMEGKRKKQK